MKTKLSDLKQVSPVLKIVSQILSETIVCGWPLRKVEAMFPILEVGSQLTASDVNANGNWPRDFIEALIRPDWRLWVEAVKSENDSWKLFEATIEIPYRDIQKGASVIPLEELFTIKRSGKYKFRQIALGNLLKEEKDYGETFALRFLVMGSDGFALWRPRVVNKSKDGMRQQGTFKRCRECLSTPICHLIMGSLVLNTKN
jgi:hypothetical protein